MTTQLASGSITASESRDWKVFVGQQLAGTIRRDADGVLYFDHAPGYRINQSVAADLAAIMKMIKENEKV